MADPGAGPDETAEEAAAPPPEESRCPRCHAPPSPGRWCMACGAEFPAPPQEGAVPPGGSIAAKKFTCEGCGALMLWDAATQELKCPFCGGTRGVERSDGYVAVEHALEDVPPERRRTDAPKVFRCDGCGAQVRFEGSTVAARCPFCGSEHVVERQGDVGRILPESVLPFAVEREAALDLWRTWLGRGIFRPRALRREATEESLQGVYVPFWTYDTRTHSRWTAEAGHYYTVTVSAGNGQTRTETRVRWTPAWGERSDFYDDVLVCASRGLDEGLIDEIAPFPLERLDPYRSEYLSGWLAEEYVVDLAQGWSRARERVNASEVEKCGSEVPGDTHRFLRVWTQHAGMTWKHVLLPVWAASYRWREKTYRFLVNGQTGEVAGTAPISPLRVAIAVVLGAGLAFAAWWFFRRR